MPVFFCFFAARFSNNVFAGFFFVSFFLSIPLLMCDSSNLRQTAQRAESRCSRAGSSGSMVKRVASLLPHGDRCAVTRKYVGADAPGGESGRQKISLSM